MNCAYPLGELPKEAGEKMQSVTKFPYSLSLDLLVSIRGTEDIYVFADKKNGNMKTYANEDNIPGASRTLEERWINYFANRIKVLSAKTPPIAPTNNAGSYAGAGTGKKYLQCLVMMSRGQTHSTKVCESIEDSKFFTVLLH